MTWYEGIRNSLQAIHYFVEHDDLAPAFAKFVFDIFRMFQLKSHKIGLKTFRQHVEEPYSGGEPDRWLVDPAI
jgi:hypothetical protein